MKDLKEKNINIYFLSKEIKSIKKICRNLKRISNKSTVEKQTRDNLCILSATITLIFIILFSGLAGLTPEYISRVLYVILAGVIFFVPFTVIMPFLISMLSNLKNHNPIKKGINYLFNFFRKKENSKLIKDTYLSNLFISKKLKKLISHFEQNLNDKEKDIYETLQSSFSLDKGINEPIYQVVSEYLNNNEANDILNNKKDVLLLLDNMEKNSDEQIELINLYKEKTLFNKKSKFNNQEIDLLSSNNEDIKISNNKDLLINKI